MTRVAAPKFGQHVVRIDHPRLLFRAMSIALGAFNHVRGNYCGCLYGERGWLKFIRYGQCEFVGVEPFPAVGFFKSPIPRFMEEREVRMFWPWIEGKPVRADGLLPISCPEAAQYCTRLAEPPVAYSLALSGMHLPEPVTLARPALRGRGRGRGRQQGSI
jgi:hypothetical protein